MTKPFIKWVGGKTRLLNEIVPRLPKEIKKYYEPFLGGGALYFHLNCKAAHISDINSELINAYQVIQTRVDLLIDELKKYQNDFSYYMSVRELDRNPDIFSKLTSVQRAARFIYLNKTCFSGLYRVNSKGQFNVPFGYYESPKILDIENLLDCSAALQNTTISCESFNCVLEYANQGDFVYFDPPYIPDQINSTFTLYTKDGFDMHHHLELLELCNKLHSKGVFWMQSNSPAPVVYKMYEQYNIHTVSLNRTISKQEFARKRVSEVIITNY